MTYSNVPEPEDPQRRATAQAERVLQQYTLGSASVLFVQQNAGLVFRVDADDGPLMLKLYQRVGRGSNIAATQLEEGMHWLAGFAQDTAMVVQAPLINQHGQYVSEVCDEDGTVIAATLQRWLEGQPLRGNFTAAHLRRIGRMMAQLHNQSANHPVFPITPSVQHDVTALWNNLDTMRSMLVPGVITPSRFSVIDQAAERIAAIMSDLGTAPVVWGAVHGTFTTTMYSSPEMKYT